MPCCCPWQLRGGAWAAAGARRLAVSVPIANIRSGPGDHFAIIWNAEKYYPLEIVEVSGAWYRFTDFEGDEGWIHKSLVMQLATVVTQKPKCNIRSGPGMKSDVLISVEEGIPFKVLHKKGRWLQIQHADGDQGWIHSSLIW